MASGELTAVGLTEAYLSRIDRLDPILGAVIETNPAALDIAARRDAERLRGNVRGALHGIPVLVKDNIGTNDSMQTTAGSLALVGSRVPRDAKVVARLRAAGAIVLGKTNLSEWANMRGLHPKAVADAGVHINGWSARRGFTRSPYDIGADPCGSSSGSGVAAAANLCAVALGTETDGSIVCPSSRNAVVGIKPTVGLVSQAGLIPISHSQDTVGPMCRSVTDAAILLGAIRSPFGEVAGQRLPRDYRASLRPGALRGARIGIDRRHFSGDGADDGLNRLAERAFETLVGLGATLIEEVEAVDTASIEDDELTVLFTECKAGMDAYLPRLRGTALRSLADVIAFNDLHGEAELGFFGQELFEIAQATNGLDDPAYLAARARCLTVTRTDGIDRILARDRLDAIVGPGYGDASVPAVSGYPAISVPTGLTDDGRPGGVWLSGGFLSEPALLAFAFDLERAVGPRPVPTFQGTLPGSPPDAGIWATPVAERRRATRADLADAS